MNKNTLKYIFIAFGWTWTLYLIAFIVSKVFNAELYLQGNWFEFANKINSPQQLIVNILFSLGVYGPLIGYLLVTKNSRIKLKKNYKYLFFAFLIPFGINILSIILSLLNGFYSINTSILNVSLLVISYFLMNFLTSGTEEFGWRGFLYPEFKMQEKTHWNLTWKTGLIWAIWHYPLMIMLYYPLGILTLIISTAGFTMSIIAMAYLSNWLYEKSGSILSVMLLHAFNNTFSYAITLFFPLSPFISLGAAFIWVIVLIFSKYIEQKEVFN